MLNLNTKAPKRSKAYAPVVQLFAARPEDWVPISVIHGFLAQSNVKMSRQALKTALDRCVYVDRWLDEATGADIGPDYHQSERHYRVREARRPGAVKNTKSSKKHASSYALVP